MERIGRLANKYWYLIAIGCWLTWEAVTGSHESRGYAAAGGEYLILPMLLFAAASVRGIAMFAVCAFGGKKMCSICRCDPCDPRCPNAPDPKPKYTCSGCGYGIYDGDQYLDNGETKICRECLEDMSLDELLTIFDATMTEA